MRNIPSSLRDAFHPSDEGKCLIIRNNKSQRRSSHGRDILETWLVVFHYGRQRINSKWQLSHLLFHFFSGEAGNRFQNPNYSFQNGARFEQGMTAADKDVSHPIRAKLATNYIPRIQSSRRKWPILFSFQNGGPRKLGSLGSRNGLQPEQNCCFKRANLLQCLVKGNLWARFTGKTPSRCDITAFDILPQFLLNIYCEILSEPRNGFEKIDFTWRFEAAMR